MSDELLFAELERNAAELEAAALAGELERAATLLARRTRLLNELRPPVTRESLRSVHAAGERAAAALRQRRAADRIAFERIRHIGATCPPGSPPSTATWLG